MKTMTVYECIHNMTPEQLAMFLNNFEWNAYVCDSDTLKRTVMKSLNDTFIKKIPKNIDKDDAFAVINSEANF